MSGLLSAMTDACRSVGVVAPSTLPDPGKWHTADIEGDTHGKDDARIKLFLDGEGGIVHNWKSGEQQTFFANGVDKLTPDQRAVRQQAIAAARIRADEDMRLERQQAAEKATAIWKEAKPVSDHPYLICKGIRSNGAKLYNDALVIPLLADGEIHSIQFIAADGGKKFLTGGRVSGCYFSIGRPDGAKALCITEGFATGASIHEATGHPVAVAFNAGNLETVAKAMRDKFPDLPLILCADDDYRTEGNPGMAKAVEAARSIGGLLAVPDFGSDRQDGATDFNDMAAVHGPEAVERAIANASEPAKDAPQPGKEDAPASEYARDVNLIRACDVTPEAITWLWNGWLAAGKMHVFGGAPGTGKTTISMGLAATVTTGGRWPDGTRSIIGNVVIWSGEDDPADTLIPRLALSGADLNRVYFIADIREGNETRSFDPARDMEPLRRKLEEIGGVRLLIVDPVVSAIAGDSHKNAEVRRGLQPLADLAGSMRCALLGITHFSKGTGGRDPVERLTGSLAFGALARVVLVAAKHQEEGEDGRTVRLFCRAKSNIGPDDGGFEYDLNQAELKTHPGIFASSVLWGDAVEGAARELLAIAETISDDESGDSVSTVSEWLRDLINEEGGKLDRRDVMRAANAMGHKERTVHRAREKLGLIVLQHGFGKDKRSIWTWPIPATETSIVPILPNKIVGTHGTNVGTHEAAHVVEVEI